MMPLSMYEDLGKVHTAKDREIDEAEVTRIHQNLNKHACLIFKIFGVGDLHGGRIVERITSTFTTNAEDVPLMSLLVKDHKPVKPGQLPSTRPVIGISVTMVARLSKLIADVVKRLADCSAGSDEMKSREHLQAAIEILNGDLKDEAIDKLLTDLGINLVDEQDNIEVVESILDEIVGKVTKQERVRSSATEGEKDCEILGVSVREGEKDCESLSDIEREGNTAREGGKDFESSPDIVREVEKDCENAFHIMREVGKDCQADNIEREGNCTREGEKDCESLSDIVREVEKDCKNMSAIMREIGKVCEGDKLREGRKDCESLSDITRESEKDCENIYYIFFKMR